MYSRNKMLLWVVGLFGVSYIMLLVSLAIYSPLLGAASFLWLVVPVGILAYIESSSGFPKATY